MRKIIVSEMITLDGVMQAPGGPDEDTSGGFKYGGWCAPLGDDVEGKVLEKQMRPSDYLLGRKTFQIWEPYWPQHGDFWPAINSGTKYVLSTTLDKTDWENTVFIKTVADIEKLKATDGPDIQVWGSSEVVQLLLKNGLVDEIWLKVYPVMLGAGKKLFAGDAFPATFDLVESAISPSGIVMATYRRAGEVKTGRAGE